MNDVIEVSYTGDLLAHRRCPRAWAYEKYAGFHPYEQVQAMEGRLIHHAMEWLARRLRETGREAKAEDARQQLERYFRVLWARGFRTTFMSKEETLTRVMANLFPQGKIDPIVSAAIKGAVHTEYELRTVRKLVQGDFAGKSRLMLTGVLDLVVQQQQPLTYERSWVWTNGKRLKGKPAASRLSAATGDLEIWDYKGTRAETTYKEDYVRQLLTYAALYRDQVGTLPKRCVLFFVNEPSREARLLAVPIDDTIVDRALAWTLEQVKHLRQTTLRFEKSPCSVDGGSLQLGANPVGERIDGELSKQCTACSFRFDCSEYIAFLKDSKHPDVRLDNVSKN
jgi:hypothetical protein